MFNLLKKEITLWLKDSISEVTYSSFSLKNWLSDTNNKLTIISNLYKTNKRMNIWTKVAAGVLTGLAVVGALCVANNNTEKVTKVSSDEIPDEILDGPLEKEKTVTRTSSRGNEIRRKTEREVRNFQDGLSKVSNVIGNLSVIISSILRILYEEPYDRINTSTYIY